MIITVKCYWGNPNLFYAFWGDSQDTADFWGEGRTHEDAVRDLLDNYDIPVWLN